MIIHHLPLVVEFLGTPEAGKTTTIHRLEKVLSNKYRTLINQESAELLPTVFKKGSLEANFWMRLKTFQSLLEKQVSKNKYDILLIDRGLVDAFFWDFFYKNTGIITSNQVKYTNNFIKNIGLEIPNLVVILTTTPEEALRRRGGEGRIVTMDFLKDFNHLLHSFKEAIPCPSFYLDTTGISNDEVIDILLKEFEKI